MTAEFVDLSSDIVVLKSLDHAAFSAIMTMTTLSQHKKLSEMDGPEFNKGAIEEIARMADMKEIGAGRLKGVP